MALIDKLFGFIEKISKRNWSADDIEKYIGNYKKAYIGYSNDAEIRKNAASGGSATQILKTALEKKEIDGAIVCKSVITEDNKVRAKLYIASSYTELLESQGSKYVLTNYSKEVIPLIKSYKGKLGIIGLPCEISAIKRITKNNPELNDKIIFTISLFCGHASDTELIDSVTEKILKGQNSPIEKYTFRKGHWSGRLEAKLKDGTIINRSAFDFNQYQNLYFHCSRKCFSCYDHFGYDADINLGDVWLFNLKDNPIKHNILTAKTQKGYEIIENLTKNKNLITEEIPIEKVLDAQTRSIVLHYNVSSRHKMGKKFGLTIPDRVKIKTKWHQNLLAWLILYNWKWSKSKNAHRIFKIPKPIIKLYLYFFKFLESL